MVELDDVLIVTSIADAPGALVDLGRAYWALAGFDDSTGQPIWRHRSSDLDFAPWSGSAHIAAAAGVVAVSTDASCASCGAALSLTSRQAFADALVGRRVECRACNTSFNSRAASVLDPTSLAKRQAAAESAAARREDLENARVAAQVLRSTLADRYPVLDESAEYLIDQASMVARVGALAVLHAMGDASGMIEGVELGGDAIGPSYDFSRDFFRAAWEGELLQIHPTSPPEAFVWDGAQLTGTIYPAKVRFYFPGEGTIANRAQFFAEALRLRLDVVHLWSTQRVELLGLAERVVAEEAARYLTDQLDDHGLSSLTDRHQEELRTHTRRGASLLSLGHLYRLAWSAARDASSAHQRHSGMSRQDAVTYGLRQFERLLQRAVDDPAFLSEPFSEQKQRLPLSAATAIVFRSVLGLDPMTASPNDVRELLASAPDEQLRRECVSALPLHVELMEAVRTSAAHLRPDRFKQALATLEDWHPRLCAPGCSHADVDDVARNASRLYDRVVARVGDESAVVVVAESFAIADSGRDWARPGGAVLQQLIRLLDPQSPEDSL